MKLGTYYIMDLGTKLLGSGILNFGPCASAGHPELSAVGRDDPPRTGVLLTQFIGQLKARLQPHTYTESCSSDSRMLLEAEGC